jgi:hypothetical protein
MSRNQRRNRRNKPGGSQTANRAHTRDRSDEVVPSRSSTETKSAPRTTELIAYAGTVLAVIMTALALDEDGRGGADPFGAETAIRYITYLTIGYMVARGLAKSGSHENRVEHSDDDAARTRDDESADGDVDEQGGGTQTVETADAPSEVQHAEDRTVDARA